MPRHHIEPTEPQADLARLTRAAQAARDATRLRDELIVAARAGGLSLRDLAAAAGMSHSGIVRVLERSE